MDGRPRPTPVTHNSMGGENGWQGSIRSVSSAIRSVPRVTPLEASPLVGVIKGGLLQVQSMLHLLSRLMGVHLREPGGD